MTPLVNICTPIRFLFHHGHFIWFYTLSFVSIFCSWILFLTLLQTNKISVLFSSLSCVGLSLLRMVHCQICEGWWCHMSDVIVEFWLSAMDRHPPSMTLSEVDLLSFASPAQHASKYPIILVLTCLNKQVLS